MADKAIYQHHERTTTVALEADLQNREIGIDPVLKVLTALSEVLGTKLHAVTLESPNAAFVGNISVGGTLGVTGAVTLSSTLAVAGAATLSNNLSVTGTSALTGNITLSRAAVGSTVSATISNTSNSSGSQAVLLLSTTGSSAGDPYIQFTANTASWVIGQRNAGPNEFSICYSTALGTNERFTIGTGGGANLYGSLNISGTLFMTGVATFNVAPVFSSVTASQILAVDGSKSLVSIATSGSGSIVLATAPTIATSLTLSYATANTAAAFDGSKNLISVTNTGTGNNVLSASPTLTGTISGAAMTLSSTLTVTGQITGSTGISIAGSGSPPASGSSVEIDYGAISNTGRVFAYDRTGSAYRAMRIGPNLDIAVSGDIAINTNKFTIAASSGDTVIAGNVTVNKNLVCGGGNGTLLVVPVITSGTPTAIKGGMYYDDVAGHLYFSKNGSVYIQIV